MARRSNSSSNSAPGDSTLLFDWVFVMTRGDIRHQLEFLCNCSTDDLNELRDSLSKSIDKILEGKRTK